MAKESSHGALLPQVQCPLIHQNILGQEHPSKICKTKIHVEKHLTVPKKGFRGKPNVENNPQSSNNFFSAFMTTGLVKDIGYK